MEESYRPIISSTKGLSELHQESMDWLSTIEFWKTEFSFFKKLIDKNFFRVNLVDKMRKLEEFGKKLEQLNELDLKSLEQEIIKHEHYLNKFESGDSDVDDVTYRNIHKEEANNMLNFDNKYKKFKLELFNCIEHVCD